MKKATSFTALAMLLITASIVYAKTITVNGDGSEWIPSEIIVDDANADNGGAGQDIDAVYFTNNTTTAYFRVDTVGNTDFSGDSVLAICIDSDDSTVTGATVPECNGIVGADFSIIISPADACGSGVGELALANYDTLSDSVPPSLNRVTVGAITEIEIGLADIEVTADGNMPIVAFKNADCTVGGDTAGGTAIIGTGSPTAVTLANTQVSPLPTIPVILVVFIAVFLIIGTIIVIRKRAYF